MFPFLKKAVQKSADVHTCSAVTPEEDMAIAEAAMAQGDLKHSAYHVGAALIVDPNRAEWLAFLDRLITISPDPLSLAPLDKDNYVGTVAVRAYVLAHLGRYNGDDGALNLVAQAAVSKPESALLEWLIQWLEAPENTGRLNIDDAATLMGWGDADTKDQRFAELFQNPAAKPFVSRLSRVAVAAVKHQTEKSVFSAKMVRLLRRNGMPHDALAVAEAVYAKSPGYFSAVSLATTLHVLGDSRRAIALNEEAHRYDLSDEAVLLDLGDINYEIGQLTEAARWYQMALEREPNHPWATASLMGVRILLAKGEEFGERNQEFSDYLNANAHNDRARWVLHNQIIPYFKSTLPEPGEATINMARHYVNEREKQFDQNRSEPVLFTITELECPSAIRSARRELQERIGAPLQLTIAHIATPDPRKPTGNTAFALWRYDGNEALPGVQEAHSPEATRALRAIAASPYIYSGWVFQAKEWAQKLDQATVPALLWAMVSPPEKADDEMPWWTWTFRVQIAATLLLAFREEGWQGTRRRAGLLALLQGPLDWSVSAAIIALVAVAEAEGNPLVTGEIRREFQKLRRAQPDKGHCCWLPVVLIGLMELPGTSREEANALWHEYRELQ